MNHLNIISILGIVIFILVILLFSCARNKKIIKIKQLEEELKLSKDLAIEFWFYPKIKRFEEDLNWMMGKDFKDKKSLFELKNKLKEIKESAMIEKNVSDLFSLIQELEELKKKIVCS